MPARDLESRLALAMLPAGAIMTLVSIGATIAVVALALATFWRRPEGAAWWIGWCIAAAGIGLYNARKAIETMSSFEWRPLAGVLALSALVLVAYPGWWIAA